MPPRILIIDDDPFTREALETILHRAGYAVAALAAGDAQALARLNPLDYRLALVDYRLPHLNGLEVARRLKAAHPALPVVMMSSELPHQDDSLHEPAPVDRFLAKPFSRDAILEVVAQLCPLPPA
jgi:CheY-like chemotaxis protein